MSKSKHHLNLLIKNGYIKRVTKGTSEYPRKIISYRLIKPVEETFFKYINEGVISPDFITKTIKSIKEINYEGFVYDITNNLENPNFILSNGVVVHNSTRADIIESLYNRDYVQENSMEVTDLGLKTVEVLKKYAPDILDEELTRHFEKEMEKIQEDKKNKKEVLSEAETVLTKVLDKFRYHEKNIGTGLSEAYKETRNKASIVGKCKVCGSDLKILYSKRFKSYFVACSAYPNCKTTFSLTRGLPKPTDKLCPECGYPIVLIIRQGKRPFEYCINKQCPKRLEWIKQQEEKKKLEEKAKP